MLRRMSDPHTPAPPAPLAPPRPLEPRHPADAPWLRPASRGRGLRAGLTLALGTLLAFACLPLRAADAPRPSDHRTITNLPYRHGEDLTPAMRDRCRLDLHHPDGLTNYATVVWFHGGGLTGGQRSIPEALRNRGIGLVAAGYRLSPETRAPGYLEDAAAAVAWTFQNIARYGGSPRRIYVAGHSAGGYLACMLGLDPRWLAAHGLDANALAGIVPYSGQCITHFTIRAERGIPDTQPVIDAFAPLHHVRSNAPPLLLITGDRNRELRGRYEENAYLWRMMKEVGHPATELLELQGYDHGGMAEPGHPLLLRFIRETTPPVR